MSQATHSPPALSTLQDWDREDWEQYDLCLWGDDPTPCRVIETIIRAANRELHWRGAENANSLRDFWYNPAKPILQRAFPDKKADPEYDFSRRMNQQLCSTLSELVQDGETSYRSLNILDESRERELHLEDPDAEKLLFVEKEAAYRKLRPLEDVYELSIVSGGGWQSTALIEDLAHALNDDETYTLYLLTDYDPTGWKIGRDFRQRAERLGVSIGEVRRVGILPQQLDSETVRRQRFSPPIQSDADRDWMDTHAIEGRYGLEIEAIGDLKQKGKALREMVVDELRDEIHTRRRRQQDTNSAMQFGVEDAIERVMHDVTADLQRAIATTVVDVLEDSPGVMDANRFDGGAVTAGVDLDAAEDGRPWLPDPYEPHELHDGAITGDRPDVSSLHVSEFFADRIRERIESGEIDLTAHLDLGGEGDV